VKVKKVMASAKVKKERVVEEAVELLTLPSEKSEPCGKLQDYSILLYGAKKIGKTTLASMFPKAMFLFCEPGGKALSVYGRAVKNWKELKGYVRLICKDKTFENVVVDTADYAYEYCSDYVCKKMGIDHPSDEAWGKGWKAVKAEIAGEVNRLLHSGKGVIFISHSRDEEVKKSDGDTYNKTASTLPGQAKDLLEGLVDIWAYYTYHREERVLIIRGDDYVDAGHRVEGRFNYPDGTPIKRIPMGSTKEEAYKNFVSAFENKLAKPESKKLKLRK
jgi:hypothetical protein